MLMEGVASARDIDKALKLGLNHPMGPVRARRPGGTRHAPEHPRGPAPDHGEKYRPCPLLAQYVKAGRLGARSARRAYEY